MTVVSYDGPRRHMTAVSYDGPRRHMTVVSYDGPRRHMTAVSYDAWRRHMTAVSYDGPRRHMTVVSYDGPPIPVMRAPPIYKKHISLTIGARGSWLSGVVRTEGGRALPTDDTVHTEGGNVRDMFFMLSEARSRRRREKRKKKLPETTQTLRRLKRWRKARTLARPESDKGHTATQTLDTTPVFPPLKFTSPYLPECEGTSVTPKSLKKRCVLRRSSGVQSADCRTWTRGAPPRESSHENSSQAGMEEAAGARGCKRDHHEMSHVMALVEAARKVRAITGQPFAHGQMGSQFGP